MKHWILCATAIATLSWPQVTPAADKFDPAACAKTIAPFIDDEALAVVRIDVTRLKVAALADELKKIVPIPADVANQGLPIAEQAVRDFLAAGGKDAYLVVSLRDLPKNPPLVVVPINGGDAAAMQRLLGQHSPATAQVGKVVVAGNQVVVERARTLKASDRPELASAFAAAGDSLAQVLILPTDDNRRVIEQTMPTLPPQLGGGSITVVTQGLSWLTLSVDAPPNTAVRLTIQSRDAKAAQQLSDIWNKGVEALRTEPAVLKDLPGAPALAALLKPTVAGDRLLVALDENNRGATALRDVLLKPALGQARQAAAESQSMNNMKQIGLAMHVYHDVNKTFPPAFIADKQGKQLLSWRVAILPYIEQDHLYKQFHLDEPWDSEHNKKLIAKMPALYGSPASKVAKDGKTAYLTLRGESTVFPGKNGIQFRDIPDGTSNTIMTIEADDQHAVEWTKPDDFDFNPEKPKDGLAGQYENTVIIGMADGSVRTVKLVLDGSVFKGLATRNGGEAPGDF